jgi:hypothetical protein
MKKKTPPAISKHFSNLGKASWEARKKAILKAQKLDKTTIPSSDEVKDLQTNER